MAERYPAFGSKIREVLRAKNITIEKFAEMIGVTDNFISKIISGSVPSFHNFIKIVETLGVSADYLIQDYVTPINDENAKTDLLDVIMSKQYFTLSKAQKEEVLHLVNFLNEQNNSK